MPKGDLDICLDEARAFYEVGKGCVNAECGLPISPRIYPAIVNLAFSCELHFKALMIWRNTDRSFKMGHNLVDLFNLLSAADQNGIKGLYVSTISDRSFEDSIEEFDKAFDNWRYAFQDSEEDNVCTIHDLVRFAGAVHDHVKKIIRPEGG